MVNLSRVRKRAVVAIVWIWIAILQLTHLGARSPYSYGWALFGEKSERLAGAVVNPDALPLYSVALFFYEGIDLDWPEAQNVRLPVHAFATSIAGGLTRSYLLASYAVNFLFAALVALAAVNLAERFAIRRPVTLFALLTLFSLPLYVEYLGQPLHYVVGISTSFLVVMAVMALASDEARRPWIAGVATAVLTLNYDPYVFLAALVAYFLFVSRFRGFRHYLTYIICALLPLTAWNNFLDRVSHGQKSTHLHESFVKPVLDAWTDFALHPFHNVLQPVLASQIGIHVAIHQIMAMIHWPLLAACIWLLIKLRPRIAPPSLWIAVLLPCALVAEQIAAAPWDWELNPRRAIPVVLAFGVAWIFATDRVWTQRAWRIAVVALFVVSGWLAVMDTFNKTPALAFLHTGQAIREAPQEAMAKKELRLTPKSMPALMADERIDWHDLGRARVQPGRRAIFAFSQLFNLALLAAPFWLAARARLLPRWSPAMAAALWLASLIRFI